MSQGFQFIGLSCPGSADLGVAIAASDAGATGLVDISWMSDLTRARELMSKLSRFGGKDRGVRILPSQLAFVNFPSELNVVLLAHEEGVDLGSLVAELKSKKKTVLLEAISLETARRGESAGVDAIIAKGQEAGGWVGEESAFVLLQRLLGSLDLPIWAQGGIGLHTSAACFASGAAGVILDSQLGLTHESSLDADSVALLSRMDGSETVCLGTRLGAACRVYCRRGPSQVKQLRQVAENLDGNNPADLAAWRKSIATQASNHQEGVWLIGQEAVFAAPLAARFRTVRGVIEGFRDAGQGHVRISRTINSIGPDSALAHSHGTRYPIVQGPMTRVSDTAEFALEVANGGGLPLLALALMSAPEVSTLLKRTRALLGGRAWGVGILGFVPQELRAKHIEVVRQYRPPFALIAGGRPDQCWDLEREGIRTYLHVPSTALLRDFVENGVRRFVFEGRECGGHVGPRSSFVLWNSAIDCLLECLPQRATDYHVLFAGGIHDALSASMVAVLSAPLAERGVRTGVLMGTAYLFTREAVSSGAIVQVFQEQALGCAATTLLESGPGHSIRCAATPYAEYFAEEKRRLRNAGRDGDHIRAALEELNLGRLRIASKGLRRTGHGRESCDFESLTSQQQRNEGMYMIGQIAGLRDQVCTIPELHENVSSGAWNRLQRLSEEHTPAQSPRPESHGIAIIGMASLLPKTPDLQTYWHNILNKVDAVTEVPRDRWDWRQYYSDDPKARDKVCSRWGGFLDEIVFDPLLYGMPPSNIPSTEPLQLLTLEVVRKALEDAGYADRTFPRERTAVILGLGGGSADLGLQYAFRAGLPMFAGAVPAAAMASLPEWTENSFPGILLNVVAGRVANRFDLGGVNYTVDGACASALAAVYQSARELETGTSDLVITGGVDTLQSPFAYLCFSKTNALSPRGRCRTFDESADGIAISEGLVILVLKRLSDAERDHDRIYAVIKGIAGSSDGKDKGLTAPRREGQVRALERAYAQAGISPAEVTLVEAHGTGTVVGDQVEIEALNEVYRNAGAIPRSCAVGSVKSNIGHTKSAAGAAGLAKAALALHHKVLPPTIGVTNPNKALTPESPFYINTEARPWIASASGSPRRAAVSAFGFGGTNFHAVLEEYTKTENTSYEEEPGGAWPTELLLFTAESPSKLSAMVRSLDDALRRGASPKLVDLGYTLWRIARREPATPAPFILAVIAGSLNELRERVALCGKLIDHGGETGTAEADGVYFSGKHRQNEYKVAFLFPGQGSQYPEMLRGLATHFPEVRHEFEIADRVLADRFPVPLSTYVFPPPRFDVKEDRVDRQALTRTDIAQPALGVAGIALFRLLEALGIRPDMAAGHSYGEYVALCAAGVFPEETLYTLSEARGRFVLASAPDEPLGMAAIEADRNTVTELLRSVDSVWVANLNAPNQTVISGTKAGIEQASALFETAGLTVRALAVSCAFHSPLIAAARDRLAEMLSLVKFSPARFPVFSNSSGAPYPSQPTEIVELLSNHLVSVVDFAGGVQAMYEAGARIFVESGPRNALTGLVTQILKDRPHIAVALDDPARSELLQLQHVLGQLAAFGVPVQLDRLYRNRKARELNLASLVEDTREPPLAPTAWLVTGGRARPASDPKPASAAKKSAASESVATDALPERSPDSEGRISDSVSPLASNANGDFALLQFQQVMAKILDTQREVMLAYLHSSNGVRPHLDLVTDHDEDTQKSVSDVFADASGLSASEPIVSVPSPLQPSQNAQDLTVGERFLEIVSERTGYPIEVLVLDQKIEADLGIDSLKISEILAAFQQSCASEDRPLIRKSMEDLAKARTLRAMIGLLDQALNKKTEAGSRPNRAQSSDTDEVPQPCSLPVECLSSDLVPRSRLAAVEALACDGRPLAEGSFLITDDEQGVAVVLAKELRQRGLRVSLVRFGRTFATDPTGSYVADLSEPDSVTQVVRQVRQRQRGLSGIIHLLPLKRGLDFDSMDSMSWQRRIDEEIKSLFLLASTAAADLKASAASGRAWLVSATEMGGGFGADLLPHAMVPSHGGLVGILKCLALEWPGVRCKAVDFEPGQVASSVAHSLISELSADDDDVEVGYRGSKRIVLRSVAARREEIQTAERAIDQNSIILMTGGGHGITAEFAVELAQRYKPTLLIVGRSAHPENPEDPATAALSSPRELKAALIASAMSQGKMTLPEIDTECRRIFRNRELRRNLQAMRETGAPVKYFPVDVREAAFRDLIDSIYRTYGRIDGVVHGAGMIDDKLIENKNAESFDRVFNTKVSSAFVLSRALRPESLKFLVFFSSISACFGNPGQADYAAANGVLDKLALYLDRAWPTQVFSINWGPWAGTGMVSPSLRDQFSARGIDLIAPFQGVRSLDWEIRHRQKGEEGIILGHGPWAIEQFASGV
jgi:acyl transferase domain-containing protein/NAD(P)H-dependent flavin oxidoreductase YrpB (nitropropane dioxygenase family)